MSPQILTAIGGTSSVFGALSLIAYFYFRLRLREIRSSERSVVEIVEGEGIIRSDQVIEILKDLKDEKLRVEALRDITKYSQARADRLYNNIREKVDVLALSNQNASRKNLYSSLISAISFVLIAILAFGVSWVDQPKKSAGNHPRLGVEQNLRSLPSNTFIGTDQDLPLKVAGQFNKFVDRSNRYFTIFKVENDGSETVRNIKIQIFVESGSNVKFDYSYFASGAASCSNETNESYHSWEVECSSIGGGGFANFAFDTTPVGEQPEGTIVISSVDGITRLKF